MSIKKFATYLSKDGKQQYTIEQAKDGSINISPYGTKTILRLLFADLGQTYDENWNTQTMGEKLIELINKNSTQYSNDESQNNEEYFEDDEEERSDKNWAWWSDLNLNMKFALLYNIRHILENEDDIERDEDDNFCVYYDSDIQNDREDNDGLMSYIVDDFIVETQTLTISEASQSEVGNFDVEFRFEGFEQLAYLPNLTEIDFSGDDSLTFLPTGLDNIKTLKRLNFQRTDLGFNDPNKDWQELLKIANALPNLEYLNLSDTVFAQWLDKAEADNLKALLPHCEIMLN